MVKLEFLSKAESEILTKLEVFTISSKTVVVKIEDCLDNDFLLVALDKQTAIKLAKELKKQISFLED